MIDAKSTLKIALNSLKVNKMRSALTSLGIIIGVSAVIIMLAFVFPAFEEMFNNLGRELPPITRACMDAGNFMKQYWIVCIAGTVATLISLRFAYKQPYVRQKIDAAVLHLPL